jgi:hypothetical protein
MILDSAEFITLEAISERYTLSELSGRYIILVKIMKKQ